MENNILQIMIDYMAPSIKNLVKCFDGVMLPIGQYDLKGCEKAINKKYKNINIKLDIKAFDEALKLPLNIPKYTPVQKVKGFIFGDPIIPHSKQLRLFNLLLNEIPVFYTNYEGVKFIIYASKNWCNCWEVADKVDRAIMANFKGSVNITKIWNCEKHEGVKPITIATLLKAHQQNENKKKKLKTTDYNKFRICHHIDPLEGYDKLNIDIRQINQQYITNINGTPNIKFDFTQKNKVIMIRSHTGSGKTEFLRYIANTFNKHSFISVATRVVLAEYHSQIMGTHFYGDKNIKLSETYVWARNDKAGMSVVIDSLIKIKINPELKYVLFLDEVSSLLEYIVTKENLKKRRRDIFNILVYLILHSEYVFCVDADLNTHTIKFIYDIVNIYDKKIEISDRFFVSKNVFIKEFDIDDIDDIEEEDIKVTKKDIILFNNNFKVNRCNVIDYSSMTEIIKMLIDDIKNFETLFICSDKNEYFYNNVFQKIISYLEIDIKLKKHKDDKDKKLLKMIKNGSFSFYSSDMGNKDDFKNGQELKKKIVFVTPCITTGVDLNYKAKVYGLYFGDHLTATTIVQQLGRIRQPQVINLYFSHSVHNITYDKFEDLVTDNKKAREQMRETLGMLRPNLTIDAIEGHLKNCIEFTNEKLMNVRFYTLDILRNKGDNIIYQHYSSLDLLAGINIKKKEIKIDPETLAKRYQYICQDFTSLDEDKFEALNDIVCDDKKFNSHINFRKIKHHSEKDLLMEIAKTDDLEDHNIGSRAARVLLLQKFMKKLNIKLKRVNYEKCYEELSKSKETYKMPIDCIKAFRLNAKTYGDKLTALQARELLMTMINNLMPSFVSCEKGKTKDRKDIRFKVFDYKSAKKEYELFNKER